MLRRTAIGLVLALLVALPAMAQDFQRGLAANQLGDYTTGFDPLRFVGNIFGAVILGLLIQGCVYKLLTKFNVAKARAAYISGAVFATIFIFLGALGASNGGPLNFEWAISVAIPATFLVTTLILVGIRRSSKNEDRDAPPTIAAPENQMVDQGSSEEIHPARNQATNFVAIHWRGDFPLWVSYWLIGFAGNIATVVFIFVLTQSISSQDYNPYLVATFIVVLWTGGSAIFIWDLVGVWRSATHYAEAKVRVGRSTFWAPVAKFMVIIGVLRFLSEFVQAGIPQLSESIKIAFLDDPDIPAYSLRVMRGGTEIEVTGGFKFGLHEEFIKQLETSPLIRVVHLRSSGGRIGEAKKLHDTIKSRRLMTYVPDECDSACTVAFLGGAKRWKLNRAKLGFHSAYFPGMGDEDQNGEFRRIYRAAGVDSGFIEQTLSTPHDKMWYPQDDVLKKANVISGVVRTSRFAASGMGGKLSFEDFATTMESVNQALKAIKIASPKEFNYIVERFRDGYLAGSTESDLLLGVNQMAHQKILSSLMVADDEIVLEGARILIAQYQELKAQSGSICYGYASGTGRLNYAQFMSQTLLDRESSNSARAISKSHLPKIISMATIQSYWREVFQKIKTRRGVRYANYLGKLDWPPSHHEGYCTATIYMMEEILRLSDKRGAHLMRNIYSNMAGVKK